jgi:hypothetical protein
MKETPPFGSILASEVRNSIIPGTSKTDKIIRSFPVDRSENEMVEWAQMQLERVDMNAEVLASLLTAAYKQGHVEGRRIGYSEGQYWAGKSEGK